MKTSIFRVGCSSFDNREWKGLFYPDDIPRTKWFEFYCQHFNTYEMNGTFYKFPTLKSLQKWHQRTPDDFIFSVKAPKVITHFKKFVDCSSEIGEFYQTCIEGLGEKLGGILFQTPPSFSFSEERLEHVVNQLDPNFKNIVEFRHQSWWNNFVTSRFTEHQIVFCNVSYPNLPETSIKTNKTGYMRLHGNNRLFYSEYSEIELANLYQNLIAENFETIFIYFNNTASHAGITNAIRFQKLISDEKTRLL